MVRAELLRPAGSITASPCKPWADKQLVLNEPKDTVGQAFSRRGPKPATPGVQGTAHVTAHVSPGALVSGGAVATTAWRRKRKIADVGARANAKDQGLPTPGKRSACSTPLQCVEK